MEPSDPEEQQKVIREEYLTWKASAPELYDMVLEHTLTWPSLTCQWMPTVVNDNQGYTIQELLIGTNTNDEEPNYVEFLKMSVPSKDISEQEASTKKPKWEVVQKILHEGEVNRARYQPSNPDIIATKTRDGPVLLFDRKTAKENECTPILRLVGHSKEGFGLEWSPHASMANHILSAGYDHLICHWDIGRVGGGEDGRTLEPYQCYKGHTNAVGDISWHGANESVFASVGDDMKLLIWDTRTPEKPANSVQAHRAEINTVAFNRKCDYILATGSNDKTIGLFDIRRLPRKLHSLEFHEGPVLQVAWSPFDEAILASASADRRIDVWDLKRIGEEQTPADMMDGPPELLFMHSGHTSTVTEFSWNPSEQWVLASAAEDNIMQFWEMSKTIYANKPTQVDEKELE